MLGFAILGWVLLVSAAAGILYTVAALIVFRRFFAPEPASPRRSDAVTLLKPLHGAEPLLAANLASFLTQDHDGPIQLLCGVQRSDDRAIGVVERLKTARETAIDLVIDSASHGASGKISNLINMMPRAAHPILILSDSDMVVAPDYLPHLLAALDQPDTGAVTCLYRGRGDVGFWSRLGAAGLSYQFLPGAVFGVALGLARPCMGSTIAMRRETLDRIGGFARFVDVLADDYAIGAAIHALGLEVAVPPMLVTHGSAERSFAELWRHELRWGATVRGVVPGAYAGSVIGMPLPLALLGSVLAPAHAIGALIVALSLLARTAMALAVDRQARARTAPLWLLPVRDCLTFAIFVATFFTRSVDWRGQRLRMGADGRITADPEISA
ncbi:bacteriohopanetetrol glucosamine biosynthesis glycosyltransferase HpnI [Sphingomonas oligophenolica]|uniref:Bacteriohopanetetrol glucosamine biosynthesis glycosyltransferase HpnI n=1 Tax=Sphingomonas oligophenolica TaxID=301154 RepID=A0ABU9YAR9_9SPHN